MATKTISIDLDAYEALARRKKRGQSFSDVIKEHFAGGTTGASLLRALRGLSLDAETLDAVDERIAERGKSASRAAEL